MVAEQTGEFVQGEGMAYNSEGRPVGRPCCKVLAATYFPTFWAVSSALVGLTSLLTSTLF